VNRVIKVSDYREHAVECRRLARQSALPHLRDDLLKMAEAWDQLAEQREQEIARGKVRAMSAAGSPGR
jgi:hypothetical protein